MFEGSSLARRWVLLFVAIYPLVAVWSVTNPMFASPDENLHMIRAQSIARGDFSNPFTTDGLPIDDIECMSFQQDVTANCMALEWGADGTEQRAPTEGYPPLFHGLAAIPSLVFSGLVGAYVMRLWLGAIVVAVAAWAGAIVSHPGSGRWPFAGFLLAMTPMTVFTMSTVNPSGLSAAGALLTVAAAIALYRGDGPPRSSWIAAATGAAVLALTRRDGLLFLAVIAVMLAPLVPWRAVGAHLRRQSGRWWAAVSAAVGGFLLVFALWGRTTASRFYDNWSDGGGEFWWEVARYVKLYLYQAVGVFGWLDSPIGDEAYLVAMITVGAVVFLGVVGRDRRLATSTALAVALLVATPVLFGMVRFPYLQGRYLLPIWAAGMVVAGASVARAGVGRELTRRLVTVLLSLWLVVHAVGALQNLRRYAVGRSGSWDFVIGGDAAWNPPGVPNPVAVLAFAVAFAVLAVVVRVVLGIADDGAGCGRDGRSDLFGETPRHAMEDRPADGQRGERPDGERQ